MAYFIQKKELAEPPVSSFQMFHDFWHNSQENYYVDIRTYFISGSDICLSMLEIKAILF
jgi:hypothetical protein